MPERGRADGHDGSHPDHQHSETPTRDTEASVNVSPPGRDEPCLNKEECRPAREHDAMDEEEKIERPGVEKRPEIERAGETSEYDTGNDSRGDKIENAVAPPVGPSGRNLVRCFPRNESVGRGPIGAELTHYLP